MKRLSKIVSVALVALLAIALISCSTTSTVESVPEIVVPAAAPAEPAPAPAPAPEVVAPVSEDVIVSASAEEYPFGVTPIVKNTQGDDVFDLFIVHTNDVHARVTAGEDDSVGYAKLATIIKTARSITDNILVLDAGDVTHGTNFANLFNGATVGELLIMSGYDAVAPGNHDFNYGIDNLLALSDEAEAVSDLKVLSANITDENGYLLFQPYQIYDFNGFKVCVIGLTTPDTKTKSHPKNTEGVEFDNPVVYENAQAAIDLAHEIADYVVVLGHIGTVADGESGLTSTIICENIDGIDLFVDGHSHSVLSGDNYVNGTLIVSAGEYMQNIGVVDILVKNGEVASENAFLIASSDVLDPANSALCQQYGITDVPDDPEVSAYIESVNEAIEARFGEVVATIPEDLDGEREHVRTGKTNLSEIVCDAITAETGADFTIVNGGGIRASLSAGDVTLGEVNAVLPFTNIVTVCEITGDEVYQALEHGYSMLPETNGAFSQTDLEVVFSADNPVGERIEEVRLNGEPIDRNATYTVATNDFMAAGGDGYTMFGRITQEGRVLNEVFADYLAQLYPPAN